MTAPARNKRSREGATGGTRALYRSLDALLTAPLSARASLRTHVAEALGVGRSNYERLRSLACALDVCAPGSRALLARLVRRDGRLPIRADVLEVKGYGSGATVFRLETGGRTLALKVYRRTLGLKVPELQRLAHRYRAKHERWRAWFGALCLPTCYLVLHSPVREVGAVACVQPYLEEDGARAAFDPLAPEGKEAFRTAVRRHPALAASFVELARRAGELAAAGGPLPDLVGAGNVLVVPEGEEARLRLVDFGVFEPGRVPKDELAGCVRRLAELAQEVERV